MDPFITTSMPCRSLWAIIFAGPCLHPAGCAVGAPSLRELQSLSKLCSVSWCHVSPVVCCFENYPEFMKMHLALKAPAFDSRLETSRPGSSKWSKVISLRSVYLKQERQCPGQRLNKHSKSEPLQLHHNKKSPSFCFGTTQT